LVAAGTRRDGPLRANVEGTSGESQSSRGEAGAGDDEGTTCGVEIASAHSSSSRGRPYHAAAVSFFSLRPCFIMASAIR
jgi:hypothetical protein